MPIKAIVMGASGDGKSTALASLCGAGFQVRLLDLDNGWAALRDILTAPSSPYPKDSIKNLRWKTINETMRLIGGQIVPKSATVWSKAIDMCMNWQGDSRWDQEKNCAVLCEDKLGDMYNWGEEAVLALDTLSTLGTAANNFNLMMNGNLGKNRTSNEGRRDIGGAQAQLDKFLQFVSSDALKCNVILNTHTVQATEDGGSIPDNYEGTKYLFPAAIGKALGPNMGKYFNDLLLVKREGLQHKLFTRGVMNAKLKSGSPTRVAQVYDTKDGLAKYFEACGIRRPT